MGRDKITCMQHMVLIRNKLLVFATRCKEGVFVNLICYNVGLGKMGTSSTPIPSGFIIGYTGSGAIVYINTR